MYNSEDVNSIIVTNVSNIGANPVCYNIVSNFMLHSPCIQTQSSMHEKKKANALSVFDKV